MSLKSTIMQQNKQIVNDFHKLYHSSIGWDRNTFAGRKIQQFPGDIFTYSEVIYRTKPKFIIQTGISDGGSLLFFAAMKRFFRLHETLIIGIDIKIDPTVRMELGTENILTFQNKSTNPAVVDSIVKLIKQGHHGILSLDASHAMSSVRAELEAYGSLLDHPDSIIVIEDTNLNGNPVSPGFGPGPREALDYWKVTTLGKKWEEFYPWDKNLLSFHSWLRYKERGTL